MTILFGLILAAVLVLLALELVEKPVLAIAAGLFCLLRILATKQLVDRKGHERTAGLGE